MKHRGWSAVRGGRKGAQLALGLGLVLLGTAALPLHAQDGADSASQQQTALRRVRLDIPAQPLNRALLRFAEQAGVDSTLVTFLHSSELADIEHGLRQRGVIDDSMRLVCRSEWLLQKVPEQIVQKLKG